MFRFAVYYYIKVLDLSRGKKRKDIKDGKFVNSYPMFDSRSAAAQVAEIEELFRDS